MNTQKTVAVLGASANPERYSNRAVRQLKQHGYRVIPVNPAQRTIEGLSVVPSLVGIDGPVHTVTVYVSADKLPGLTAGIIRLRPQRVILNPGTEHEGAEKLLKKEGIRVVRACTLVLLSTGQFEQA